MTAVPIIPGRAYRGRSMNARFTAAAPELLAVLYSVLPFVEDMANCDTCKGCYKPGVLSAEVEAIRAAIAKAEGKQ